jgi:NAD(P)-dependent dehydrogenase (short-subunit alcohol dehydrogenase family)
VGDPDDCARVVSEVIDEGGRLDIPVNNAGVTMDRPVSAMTVDEWHTVLRMNLSGAFKSPSRRSRICSSAGRAGSSRSRRSPAKSAMSARPTTAASKAGLLGLTKTLAREAALAVPKSDKDDRVPSGRRLGIHHRAGVGVNGGLDM